MYLESLDSKFHLKYINVFDIYRIMYHNIHSKNKNVCRRGQSAV